MTIDSTLRKALLQPRSVALVGASPDLTKNNSRPQRFLKRFGFSGRVLPINPSRSEVLGERAYPDLKSAPGPIDHAFIMVPARAVPDVIDQCCELLTDASTAVDLPGPFAVKLLSPDVLHSERLLDAIWSFEGAAGTADLFA